MRQRCMLVALVAVFCLGSLFGQAKIRAEFYDGWQVQAPVKIASHHKSLAYAVNGVVLFNPSRQRVVAVRIGWSVLGVKDGERQVLKTFQGDLREIDSLPGEFTVLPEETASRISTIRDLAEQHPQFEQVTIQVGIVEARSASGDLFVYNLAKQGQFEFAPNSLVHQYYVTQFDAKFFKEAAHLSDLRSRIQVAELGIRVPQAECVQRVSTQEAVLIGRSCYKCDDTTALETCQVQSATSCTGTICTYIPDCQKQTCTIHDPCNPTTEMGNASAQN